MDGTSLQALIYKGYGRTAAKTGRAYDLYRPGSPLNPTDPSYKIGTIDCLFANEKRFEVPHKFKEPVRYLYADGRELQQGDFLIGPYGTFYVGTMEPNLPMQAIRCNESVTIERGRYVGAEIVYDTIATNFPSFRQLKKVDQKPVVETFGASTSTTPFGEWFLFIPIDKSIVEQNDRVTDETGRVYSISTIDPTEIGTVLVIRQNDTVTT